MQFKLHGGLDLPISGAVTETEIEIKNSSRVAVSANDYTGMKPSMLVKAGDRVKIGQPLFSCKKNIGLTFTSPAAGTIEAVNRGEKRKFESIVIQVDGTAEMPFQSHKNYSAADYDRDAVVQLLLESGEWASIRQRPFNKVADVGGQPNSMFITAIDTNPLAPDPKLAIQRWKNEFDAGVEILSKLPKNSTFVCTSNQSKIELPENIKHAEFSGPHPAGNVGTHIHFIDPVHMGKMAWHVGYQDVIAIGHLFLTGRLFSKRLVSVAGPKVKHPQYIETQKGACISELVEGNLKGECRVISGSALNGHVATGALDFLGHFDNQVTAIEEDRTREFLGWQSPGLNKFSTKSIYLSNFLPKKIFDFGSSTHGSKRAMVPIGMFEKIMPLDILPTQLLRALVSKDTETSQDLGCLELAEEDLALCTFVSPGKVDFGPILRETLEIIEREG